MSNRLYCALAALIVLGTPSIVTANPVTYDFSGTLAGPINGSDQFTGSFTINVNPTVSSTDAQLPGFYPYQIRENGNDVSLTVTIGGQTINYINTAESPYLAQLYVSENPKDYPVNPSGDSINVSGSPTGNSPGIGPGFELSLSIPTDVIFSRLGPNNVANLPNLNLSASNIWNADFVEYVTGSSFILHPCTITSVEAVTAPEPSTLAVFAMLGGLAIVHQRRRKSSRELIAR